jgi:ATP-dependent protease ClpP protease subunit
MTWKFPKKSQDETAESDNEIRILTPMMNKDGSGDPQGNKIYFYSDVTKDSVLNLNRQIDDLSKQMKMVQYSYRMKAPPAIEIHISSDGGEIFPAMSSVDKIAENEVPIHTYCEGIVASAATLISVVGKKRFMSKNACMLIHQITSGLWGSYMEFKDEVQNLDLIMGIIKKIYLKNTHFDDKTLENLLKHDLYLSADDCLKHGLIDVIL